MSIVTTFPDRSAAASAVSGLADTVRRATTEPAWVRWSLIGITWSFLTVLLVLPVAVVFVEALRYGWVAYGKALIQPHTLSALWMTVVTVGVAVPVNTVFGLAAAWAIAKFEFRGKNLLISLIDLPLAVSPVVSGLVFVLIFGKYGWFGSWLLAHDIKIIFAAPGMILATIFVTFPYVAHELIPLMQEQGSEEEEAAVSLGAGGWQTFFRVTLPNIKWALLYGVILCTARAIGEFGAVAVVAGSVAGRTNTLPLQIETLYGGNRESRMAAFAIASVLVLTGLVTLTAKTFVEARLDRRSRKNLEPTEAGGTP
ncbi:MAG: sulfate ABC transporter permease subunit CysW [Planctomycetes bacterium]|nr:sulfate ABC transporter permease subunit CysW [Planctomycetota bacterium]